MTTSWARAEAVLGRALSPEESGRLDRYVKLLLEWNRVQRLVGTATPDWIAEHVVADSLLFLRVLPEDLGWVADVGSGAGVPGVPLKIVRPDWSMTLIESRQRRVSFLAAVVRELALEGLRVLQGRAESLGDAVSGRFDAVVARCVADVDRMLELGMEMVRPGGVVVVAGPPKPRALRAGEWVSVAGVRPGETRWFAHWRRP